MGDGSLSAMPVRRITLAEWIEQQRARDPGWDRFVDDFIRARGPKRKVPLLLDENLEADLAAQLRTVDYLKVTIGWLQASDEMVWGEARRTKQVIVTTDEDFWNDRKYPLAQSPGVIIVAGRSAEEKVESLAVAFGLWNIDNNWRKVPYFLDGSKLKASAEGVSGKHWTGEEIIFSYESRR
jgi:predicted nuclease of predicted toxin-antitoxin system